MKIAMQTWGSEGDISPMIALAAGLSKEGHEVTLAITSLANKDYSPYAEKFGFKLIPVRESLADIEDYSAYIQKALKKLYKRKRPLFHMEVLVRDLLGPSVNEIYAISQELCAQNDVMIGHFFAYPVKVAAEKAGIPYISYIHNPMMMASRYEPPIGTPSLGLWSNSLAWRLGKKMLNGIILKYINQLRTTEGLPPARDVVDDVWSSLKLTLMGFSPTIFAAPPDWGKHLAICGYFELPEEASADPLDADLQAFISAGPPPVYMTFGSYDLSEKQKSTDLFIEVAQKLNCRTIIQTNKKKLEAVKNLNLPNVYFGAWIDHRKVFPQCEMVVHHGGSGTTHTVTKAGCPSVIVAHNGDQRAWGKYLLRKGIAPKLLFKKDLTVNKLIAAIQQVKNSPEMKVQAVKMAQAMQAENGVQTAIKIMTTNWG